METQCVSDAGTANHNLITIMSRFDCDVLRAAAGRSSFKDVPTFLTIQSCRYGNGTVFIAEIDQWQN